MSDKKKSLNPDGDLFIKDVYGTNHTYFQARHTLFNDTLFSFKRAIAGINPFAYQQIPNQKRVGFEIRTGNNFYIGQPYPNPVMFNTFFPQHYDPLASATQKNTSIQLGKPAPQNGELIFKSEQLPRGCIRSLQGLKRCVMVNGEDKCSEEKANFLGVCPNWALEDLKEKERQLRKIEAIQTNTYRRALEVSPYNQGKSNKDVSDKTWIHGTREYLRPDTLWADERYTQINQAEINEAKERIRQRDEKAKQHHRSHSHGSHGHDSHAHGHGGHGGHHYDFKGSEVVQEKPLYP